GNLLELLQAAEVDQQVGQGHAQVEHRQQRLAAGNRRGGRAVERQRGARFGHRLGRDVIERRRLHASASRMRRARSIASATRRGASGVSLKLAPISRKASATALAIAAGGAIAPPSPNPFTPYSVVSAGVTRCAMRTSGISGAHGTI